MKRRPRERGTRRAPRRGAAAVMMMVVLLIGDLIVIGMVLGGSRDQELTIKRADTIRAFYAAEAGMNMALREMMQNVDEDGDGTIGTISDDGNDANNPSIGPATVLVTSDVQGIATTLSSIGRSGDARRRMDATLED